MALQERAEQSSTLRVTRGTHWWEMALSRVTHPADGNMHRLVKSMVIKSEIQ